MIMVIVMRILLIQVHICADDFYVNIFKLVRIMLHEI